MPDEDPDDDFPVRLTAAITPPSDIYGPQLPKAGLGEVLPMPPYDRTGCWCRRMREDGNVGSGVRWADR